MYNINTKLDIKRMMLQELFTVPATVICYNSHNMHCTCQVGYEQCIVLQIAETHTHIFSVVASLRSKYVILY